MYRSEKRSLYRFLAIYLISTFILFSIGSAILYAYEKHHLLDQQKAKLELEGNRLHHQLTILHRQFTNKLPFPNQKPFDTLLSNSNKKTIWTTYKAPSSIRYSHEFYQEDGYLYYIKNIDPYYLGVAYMVVRMPIYRSQIVALQKMILLFMIGAGFFFLVIGYFLGRLFIAPMRESIEMMNRFIEDTTHELNTPISTILTNLELIETLGKCDAKEEMKRIEIASKTLSRIYDDLTYLNLHHNYHRDILPLDLSTCLKERVLYFSTAIDAKKLVLRVDIEDTVILDIDRNDAIRLIDNLISNAIKYNTIGSSLHILLTSKEFQIKDGGIGIDQRELQNIFKRFNRANQSEGGFGIGLNIVYQIIQTYGFDISIESQLNTGTEVTIIW